MNTKIIKKLATFSVRNTTPNVYRKLLLPVSFGVSSISLLHVVDAHLQRQINRTGRPGFELHLLYVEKATGRDIESSQKYLSHLHERFPRHTYSKRALDDVDLSNIPQQGQPKAVLTPGSTDASANTLDSRVSSLPSATSRADMFEIALTRVIAAEAKSLRCETVLWGHCTTRLAERLLAETAKGRGFALPWLANDGPSPHGVDFVYPMRDLLKKEINAFVDTLPPNVANLCYEEEEKRAAISSKDMTIDGLMKDYFESVEANYPSIVTNVMRTSNKLHAPSDDMTSLCKLCKMPVAKNAFGLSSWAGDQQPDHVAPDLSSEQGLCYGCTRSIVDPNRTSG